MGLNVADGAIHMAKSWINPLSAINLSFGAQQEDGSGHFDSPSHTHEEEEDQGVNLAQVLLPVFHRVAELLVHGPDETSGVDWESLAGHANRADAIDYILSTIREIDNRFMTQHGQSVKKVRTAAKPSHEVCDLVPDHDTSQSTN